MLPSAYWAAQQWETTRGEAPDKNRLFLDRASLTSLFLARFYRTRIVFRITQHLVNCRRLPSYCSEAPALNGSAQGMVSLVSALSKPGDTVLMAVVIS